VKKFKERHQISDKIKDIKNIAKELGDLRARYKFSGSATPKNNGVDPRVINLYKNEGKLVGIDEPRDELIRRLTDPKDHKSLKIVSIVGTGGLGKTTLAKLVFDQLKQQSFDCSAFVSVGRNPNITNTLREMLEILSNNCSSSGMTNWSAERFVREVHEFLQSKRYVLYFGKFRNL
jgi:disease resistance protein RPM1